MSLNCPHAWEEYKKLDLAYDALRREYLALRGENKGFKNVSREKVNNWRELYDKIKIFRDNPLFMEIGIERFDEKSLKYIEKLLAAGEIKSPVARGLAGLDSERAWAMREKLLAAGAGEGDVAMGLAGLDSERAWAMREKLLAAGAGEGYVARGLAGLDSERAWAMREKLLAAGAGGGDVAMGLAGLDSERAWAMREKILEPCYLLYEYKNYVLQGLAGLDSERAWAMREKLLAEAPYGSQVAMQLAGSVTMGLAGLDTDRAWSLRKKLRGRAMSLAGNYITFVWRLKALGKI